MAIQRTNGIVLHPTSLYSESGIGEMGQASLDWIDVLHRVGVGIWQMLPLGPTGPTNSPYQSYSGFAGNPLLIDLSGLVNDGLLDPSDLVGCPPTPSGRVDFAAVRRWKEPLLVRAAARLIETDSSAIESFAALSPWLEDFARFMAIRARLGGLIWTEWPAPLRDRDLDALANMDELLSEEMEYGRAIQVLFFRQWTALLRYAEDKGVRIMGDLPIYVAHDSADVWANPGLFELDQGGGMVAQAGAPPGRFSEKGQLWEMPLYRWERHQQEGFSWWVERLRAAAERTHLVRFDHFNGIRRFWRIPAEVGTAVEGDWVEGPGASLLQALFDGVPALEWVAEDLGAITPGVPALLDQFEIPGMRVIQFGFESDTEDVSLPWNYAPRCAGYTSTHDMPTNVGWFQDLSEQARKRVCSMLGKNGDDISWDLIEAVWRSEAAIAITQLPDLLSLDNQARMNLPGVRDGNWEWRMSENAMTLEWESRLRDLNEATGR